MLREILAQSCSCYYTYLTCGQLVNVCKPVSSPCKFRTAAYTPPKVVMSKIPVFCKVHARLNHCYFLCLYTLPFYPQEKIQSWFLQCFCVYKICLGIRNFDITPLNNNMASSSYLYPCLHIFSRKCKTHQETFSTKDLSLGAWIYRGRGKSSPLSPNFNTLH